MKRYTVAILYVGFLAFWIGVGAAVTGDAGPEAWWLMGLGGVMWGVGSALCD